MSKAHRRGVPYYSDVQKKWRWPSIMSRDKAFGCFQQKGYSVASQGTARHPGLVRFKARVVKHEEVVDQSRQLIWVDQGNCDEKRFDMGRHGCFSLNGLVTT